MAEDDEIRTVLFLCQCNAARSIMAESILAHKSHGRYRPFSAGTRPVGEVHPLTIETLHRHGMPTEGLRSKSWHVMAGQGAPHMDFIFTVCDDAAGEPCPVWPSEPMTAHWGAPDPLRVHGSDAEKRHVFEEVFLRMQRRIELFVALRHLKLKSAELQERLHAIGQVH